MCAAGNGLDHHDLSYPHGEISHDGGALLNWLLAGGVKRWNDIGFHQGDQLVSANIIIFVYQLAERVKSKVRKICILFEAGGGWGKLRGKRQIRSGIETIDVIGENTIGRERK